jgi:pimeloyl-ACP methyl ester carboxylesterase
MPEHSVDGQRYHYLEEGRGPLVLFGHGLSCDHRLFDAQVAALRDRYRCVSLDWPGHGRSGYRPAGWSLDDLAHDTIAFVELLGGPAALVGLSQGGMVFARVAAWRPDLVSALVLLDTSARAEPPERAEAVLANAHRMATADEEERREFYRDVALPAFFTPSWLEADPGRAERELELRLSHDRAGYELAVCAVAERRAIHDEMTRVTAPTLIVVGEVDLLTPPEHAHELNELIAGSRMATVAQAGHHTPLEQPEVVTSLLAGFLDDVHRPG